METVEALSWGGGPTLAGYLMNAVSTSSKGRPLRCTQARRQSVFYQCIIIIYNIEEICTR